MKRLACFLALFAFSVATDAAEIFTPPAGDKSVSVFLQSVFGPLFGGGEGGPMAAALGIFNGACLFVGGILAAYTMVAGTMSTAHDGEMLGRKWSSSWVPIRTMLGTALTVPASGGYCAAQLLVAWVALQGVGMADSIWSGYVESFATEQGLAPQAVSPSVDKLASQMLRANVCMASLNHLRTEAGGGPLFPSDYSATDTENGRDYGAVGTDSRACGHWEAPAANGSSDGQKQIAQAHLAAARAMDGQLAFLARQIVESSSSGAMPAANSYQTALRQYQQSVSQAAAGAFASQSVLSEFKTQSTQDGWIMAGAWFMKAASLQDAATAAVAAAPVAEAGSPGEALAAGIAPYLTSYDSYMRTASPATWGVKQAADGAHAGEGRDSGILDKIIARMSGALIDAGEWTATTQDRHPLMALKDFGDKLMLAAETMAAAVIAAMTAGGILSLGTGTGAINFAGALALAVILPLFAFGAMLSVYIPLAPFVLFVGVVFGWLALVVEAIIAAPLWAVMHLHPSGDDATGKGGQGYMLVLGLALRPGLAVLGFIASMTLAQPVLGWVNDTFFAVFKLSRAGSLTGFFSVVVALGVYFGLMVFLTHKLFGLCHVIPDQLLRWIGGGVEQLGEAAAAADREGKGHTTNIAGVFTQAGRAGADEAKTGARRQSSSSTPEARKTATTSREAEVRPAKSMSPQAERQDAKSLSRHPPAPAPAGESPESEPSTPQNKP